MSELSSTVSVVTSTHADLKDYYDNEARLGLRGPLRGGRVELRSEFLDVLRREGRSSVLDFGAGPGRDGEAFQAAGHRCLGVDLAFGNARLAADLGLRVIQGSVTALPVQSSSFDAGWSMSTLMHLDESDAAIAVGDMLRVLRSGAPLAIGVWGRESETFILGADERLPGSRRPFHLRSFDRNLRLVMNLGALEDASRWEHASGDPSEDWDYHVFRLRTP